MEDDKAKLSRIVTILRQLPDGIVIADNEKPLFMNEKAYDLLSFGGAENDGTSSIDQAHSEKNSRNVNKKLLEIF